jgi:metal-sulfur cluster biosynthetic enzyme
MTTEDIYKIMTDCLDPELNIDVVSLGLIQTVKLQDQQLNIDLVFTSPGCPFADQLKNDIRTKINKVYPQLTININQQLEPVWDPSKMSASAKRKLLIGK